MNHLKGYFNHFVCLMIFATGCGFGESLILETETLASIKPYLGGSEAVLIILDLDNTLIEPAQSLGSDQWAWARVGELQTQGVPREEALSQVGKEWLKVHQVTKMRCPESTTPELIRELQAQGYPILALTARGTIYESLTLRELDQVGIDFSVTAISGDRFELCFESKALYADGILFATLFNKKGDVLKEFFRTTGFVPKRIIFVDDKMTYIKDLEVLCNTLGIDYCGFRYGATDMRVKNFDLQKAGVQWHFMHHLLSDEEAELLIAH